MLHNLLFEVLNSSSALLKSVSTKKSVVRQNVKLFIFPFKPEVSILRTGKSQNLKRNSASLFSAKFFDLTIELL